MSDQSLSDSSVSGVDTRTSSRRSLSVRLRRPGVLVPAAVVVILAGLLAGWRVVGAGGDNGDLGPYAYVTRGDLPVTVEEAGEVKADKSKVIANEVSWPVVIKEVVPDGTVAQPGQVIVQFECKELLDAIGREELDVTAAENRFIQASKVLEIKTQELANRVQRAEQDLVAAKEDLRRYEEGDWPIQHADAKKAISLAEGRLALAEAALSFKVMANADPDLDKPYSDNEIKSEKLGVEQRTLDLEKAKSQLMMLEKYDHPREVRRLDWRVVEAQTALDRAKLEQTAERQSAQHNVETRKRQLQMRKQKLEELLEEKEKLTVKAETTGLVVYELSGSGRYSNVTVEVGAKIDRRQRIMVIPDLETLEIRTQVFESVIDQVKEGIKAFIKLDCRPGKVFTGKVRKVRTLPDTQNRWLNPDVKYFRIRVAFDEGQEMEGIRPGSSATVQLILDRLVDVLQVPVAAVFSDQDQRYCWRVSGGRAQRVDVEIGRMNSSHVQILKGLSEGDCVLLAEPRRAGRVGTAGDGSGG